MKKYIFEELFEQYQLPLYRYLMQMSRNRETAEELLQETFLPGNGIVESEKYVSGKGMAVQSGAESLYRFFEKSQVRAAYGGRSEAGAYSRQ